MAEGQASRARVTLPEGGQQADNPVRSQQACDPQTIADNLTTCTEPALSYILHATWDPNLTARDLFFLTDELRSSARTANPARPRRALLSDTEQQNTGRRQWRVTAEGLK